MTEKQLDRFGEIFLQNNTEYTSVLIMTHDKEHGTQCIVKDDSDCKTLIRISLVIQEIIANQK